MTKKIITLLFLIVIAVLQSCNKDDNAENKKAQWIEHAFTSLKNNNYPKIKAVSWWHENWEEEDGEIVKLRIDSSPESLSAFQQNVADSIFINTPFFEGDKLIPPAEGIYFSAFPDFGGPEDNVTEQRITDFENLAKKHITWAYFSNNWYHNIKFPADAVECIHQTGRVPFIRMMARTELNEGVADPNYSMQNIINGQYDNDLLQWFSEAAQTGYPLLAEFGTEVNGDWFPWNGTYNGGATTTGYGNPAKPDGPERFADAYRHIVNLARQAGATNITWFFHIDANGQPLETWNDFENYYPGDEYIDWLGVSAYGPFEKDEDYVELSDMLDNIYPRLKNLSDKPIAILEFAITEM